MSKSQKIIFILGVLLFIQPTLKATASETKALIEKQAKLVLSDKRINALSIGVINKNSHYSGHFGELTIGQANTPTDQTLYEIGSVSKTMVALIIADAITRNVLSLDKDITSYTNNDYLTHTAKGQPITVRQLLSHSSGLPKLTNELNSEQPINSKQAFLQAVSNYPYNSNQGNFGYSNVGYELLGFLLSTVYEKPFDNVLQEKMYELADMSDTQINLTPQQLNHFSYGYNAQRERAKAMTEPPLLWGSSGLVKANMSDLIKYMRLQLNKNHTAVHLSHQSLLEVTQTDALAFGWIKAEDAELGTYLIHHGGIYGTQNWMIILPEQQIAISIITNSSFPEVAGMLRTTAFKIIDNVISLDK